MSERNRTIALVGAIAIILLILAGIGIAMLSGGQFDTFMPVLIGFGTSVIATLLTAAGVKNELGQVHSKVNGNFTELMEQNRQLTEQVTELSRELPPTAEDTDAAGKHRLDGEPETFAGEDMPDLLMSSATATELDDTDDRLIHGIAMPYGQAVTDRRKITASKGSVTLPPDLKRIKLLSGHTGDSNVQPVGYATAATESETGLSMSFRIARTPAGDAALTEIREGVRDGLSVELHNTRLNGHGQLQSALVTAVALVPTPAFADARVLNASIEQENITMEPDDTTTTTTEPAGGSVTNITITDSSTAEAFARIAGDQLGAAGRKGIETFDQFVDNVHTFVTDRAGMDQFALTDITVAGQPDVWAPEYLGQLWSGLDYKRRVVPLLGARPLRSLKVTGWRWTTKPAVADYAGNKAAIPTGAVATEPIEATAKRLAGGHDIDRAYFDFPNREFLDAYFRAMSESYAYESDDRAADFVITSAAANTVATQSDLIHAAAFARLQMVRDSRGAEPSFYLVNPADMFGLLEVTTLDNPAYLSLVGVDPSKFVPVEQVPAGNLIAGNKSAVTFSELPGSPIRVQAEHIAQGGKDAAVFGYYATLLHDPKGVVQVPFGAPVGG